MTYTKEQATEGISKLITYYEELKKRKTARKGRLEDIGEANVRADFIDPLFEILGWNVRNPDEYDRGWDAAEEEFSIWYYCNVCGERMTMFPNDNDHKALIEYMREHGWGHKKCHD
jgi:hypothetical protein